MKKDAKGAELRYSMKTRIEQAACAAARSGLMLTAVYNWIRNTWLPTTSTSNSPTHHCRLSDNDTVNHCTNQECQDNVENLTYVSDQIRM